jgi:V8-like Glu-specific endopeptidase
MKPLAVITALLALCVVAATPPASSANAKAQVTPNQQRYEVVDYPLYSGVHDGAGAEETIPFRHMIRVADARWMRIHIRDFKLGAGSYIILRSLENDDYQRFDVQSLPEWNRTSAYLRGDAVEVTLHVSPQDKGVFIQIDQVLAGFISPKAGVSPTPPPTPQTLCGNDNRVASNDNRVGRLSQLTASSPVSVTVPFCTAWLISNGALLTAGHCADTDPDQGGPSLPDGTLDWNASTIVEFNVPASDANGNTRPAAVNDQYPVNLTSVVFRFAGNNGSTVNSSGRDWTVFGVNRNSNTRRLPHEVYGFFRTTYRPLNQNDTLRVTGFGTDQTPTGPAGGRNAQNQTNQTSTGTFVSSGATNGNSWYTYSVDTEPANSGSPIIREVDGFTYGIHNSGGCTATGGANRGSSFENLGVQQDIQRFNGGSNIWYVDRISPQPTIETGFIMEPFLTVQRAVADVPSGATVAIVANTYNGAVTINKRMTLTAPVGTVVIGQLP